jgi:hypothetical protein
MVRTLTKEEVDLIKTIRKTTDDMLEEGKTSEEIKEAIDALKAELKKIKA